MTTPLPDDDDALNYEQTYEAVATVRFYLGTDPTLPEHNIDHYARDVLRDALRHVSDHGLPPAAIMAVQYRPATGGTWQSPPGRCFVCATPWGDTMRYRRRRVAVMLAAVPLACLLGFLLGRRRR